MYYSRHLCEKDKIVVAPKSWDHNRYKKEKLWSDRANIPVLGGRWLWQAKPTPDSYREKNREQPFGQAESQHTELLETYLAKENLLLFRIAGFESWIN